MKHLALVLFLAAAGGPTFAAGAVTPIYRCGQVYSQTPCPGGRLIDAADPRSGAQRAEAKRVSAQEKKLAAEMERDRTGKESADKPVAAAALDAPATPASTPQAKPKSKAKKRASAKAASAADFVAVEPAASKSKP